MKLSAVFDTGRLLKMFLFFSCNLILCAGMGQSRISLPVQFLDHNKGLEDTHNFYFYKDTRNLVWISSWAGLHRFDGSSVKVYLPDENDSLSIRGKSVQGNFQEDEHSNIWFTTSGGLNCYIRKEDAFRSFRLDTLQSGDNFLVTLDSEDKLWLMQGDDLYTFDIETEAFEWKTGLTACTDRLFAYKDTAGRVKYIFSFCRENQEKAGFDRMYFSGDRLVETRHILGTTAGFDDVVKDMYVDGDSALWVACNKGLYQMDLISGERKMYWPASGSEKMRLRAVERMNDSLLLIATFGDGYYSFNSHKEQFRHHYELASHEVILSEVPQSLYRDPDGGMWISVGYRGVAYYHPENLIFRHYRYDVKSPLSDSRIALNSMLEIEEGKVLGSSDKHGVVIFRSAARIESQLHTQSRERLSEDATIMSYRDSSGRVWILTESVPCIRYSTGKVSCLEFDKELVFRSICQLSEDRFLLGSRAGGLYLITENAPGRFSYQSIGSVPSDRIYSFLWKSPSGLVIGSAEGSHLDLIDPEAGFELIRTHHIDAEIHCITRMGEQAPSWLGTDKGIYLFREQMEQPDRYPLDRCLPNLIVYSILPTTDSTVLLSSNKGIHFLHTDGGPCLNFSEHNGTGAPVFYRHSYLRHSSGTYWFGNSFGLTVLDPDDIRLPQHASNVNIVTIEVNNRPAPGLRCALSGARNVPEIKAIELPYKENTVSFKFASVDYSGIGQSQFEYRLNGVDEEWIQSENRGFARYTKLSPGAYTFDVRVAGLPVTTRTLSVRINTPVYMRWWFVVLALILISSLVFWFIRAGEVRKRKLQQISFEKELALNRERLRIAHDVHDDLGSSISALGLRTKLIAEHTKSEPVRSMLEGLSDIAERLAQQVRETIWTINSDNDTVDNLITRLQKYTMEYFEATPMKSRVSLPDEQCDDPIPGNHRRQIYLAFKEALHNAYRHSDATEVAVQISFDERHRLVIEIRDNGSGFDFDDSNHTSGTGLQSMRRRMQACEGRFIMRSGSSGTSLRFIYPL